MDANEFLSGVNRPGAFQRVEWETEVKPAAAHKGKALLKRTAATVRTGVDYANLAVNADRETGELPWGEWETFPHVIRHTKAGETEATKYGRLYVLDGTPRTVYYVDGQEVTKSDFDQFLTPSARETKKSVGGTVTVKLANLRFVS